jgi:hypothetical protein
MGRLVVGLTSSQQEQESRTIATPEPSSFGPECNRLISSTIRYNPVTMHPLVVQVEKLFLPDVERLASEMRQRFQAFDV